MKRSELTTTSFDHESFKRSLIDYLSTTEEFGDFDYEGSAINTIVDLLTRDTVYNAFLANMLANESFIESAQIRGNVVSHAQKLSYTPKSKTASRITLNLSVVPSSPPSDNFIVSQPGFTLIGNKGGESYTFTVMDSISFAYSSASGAFLSSDMNAFQGQLIRNSFSYAGQPIRIQNKNVDTDTLRLTATQNGVPQKYSRADSITDLGPNEKVYFLREDTQGYWEISFGNDVLGFEPDNGSTVSVDYINTESNIVTGDIKLIPASTVQGYSNINVSYVTQAYGGSEREDIESIRFNAPKAYQSQDRALSPYDYTHLIKSQFPFILSAISWGGETNDPPRYGSVFISVLPQQGLTVTRTLKTRIEQAIQDKNVGSVTPIIVSPNMFKTHLDIRYLFDRTKTNKTLAAVESTILNGALEYGNSLREYNRYFNESEIISLLKANSFIETVIIDQTVSLDLSVSRNDNAYYTAKFLNPIKPSTVFLSDGFSVSGSASSEKIMDDGKGNIVYSRVEDGQALSDDIGSVDYDSGVVEFNVLFIQDADKVSLNITPKNENFYVKQNNIIELGNVNLTEVNNA